MPKTNLLTMTLMIGRGDWRAAIQALGAYMQARLFEPEPIMPDGERGDAYAARETTRLLAAMDVERPDFVEVAS